MQSEPSPTRIAPRPAVKRGLRGSRPGLLALVAVALLAACASVNGRPTWPWARAWQPRALDPHGDASPVRVPLRVTRTDGRQVVLDSARVVGDSVVGRARPDPSRPARPRGPAPASPADDPPLNGARVAVALAAVAGTEAWQPVGARGRRAPSAGRAGRISRPAGTLTSRR